MPIRLCIAGVSGWTGAAVARAVLADPEFTLTGAIARKSAGQSVGEVLGTPCHVTIAPTLAEAVAQPADVLIDYTSPTSVKERVLEALNRGVRVVVGTSGLSGNDYDDIERHATAAGLGVIAAGNFSLTAALAKHFALIAARYVPSWEIIDYCHAGKPDAPSGTSRELAEALAASTHDTPAVPIASTHGNPEARGATIAGTQVHSVRLPGYVSGFEAHFGLPGERLTVRHDSGDRAEPYVRGTLLAARRVMGLVGLVQGLDRLLFENAATH